MKIPITKEERAALRRLKAEAELGPSTFSSRERLASHALDVLEPLLDALDKADEDVQEAWAKRRLYFSERNEQAAKRIAELEAALRAIPFRLQAEVVEDCDVESICRDINAVLSPAKEKSTEGPPFATLYWDVECWTLAIGTKRHLLSDRVTKNASVEELASHLTMGLGWYGTIGVYRATPRADGTLEDELVEKIIVTETSVIWSEL